MAEYTNLTFPPVWLGTEHRRPPNSVRGDEDFTRLHAAIGQLTSTWELMEHSLSQLFGALIKTESPKAVTNAYGAITGSDSRCNMIRAAARATLVEGSQELAHCLDIVKVTRNLAAVRNLVAHGMVIIERDHFWEAFARFPQPAAGGAFFVTPALHNVSKMSDGVRPEIFYNSEALDDVTAAIHFLHFNVKAFTQRLLGFDPLMATRYIVWKTDEDLANADAILDALIDQETAAHSELSKQQ